jgi:hypothetical protein
MTLTVQLDRGATGSPGEGTTSVAEGSEVQYVVKAKPGFDHLRVAVDGITAPSEGTIVMNANHSLAAGADSIVVLNVDEAATVAKFRSLLTAADPVRTFADIFRAAYDQDRTLSPTAAASLRSTVNAYAVDRIADHAALERVDNALAGRVFDMDFPGVSSIRSSDAAGTAAGELPVTFLFINGMHNTFDEAITGSIEVRRLIESAGITNSHRRLFYLPAADDPSTGSVCTLWAAETGLRRNLWPLSLLEWVAQTCDHGLDFLRATVNLAQVFLNAPPESLEIALSDTVAALRRQGQGVVLIGHSQGTLASQQALRRFLGSASDSDSDRQKCVGFISLAGPSPNDLKLRNVRNFYAEGTETKDIIMALSSSAHGFRTNLTDSTDEWYRHWKRSLIDPVLLDSADPSSAEVPLLVIAGLRLHGLIPSYLRDAVMRDSVSKAIVSQVAAIRSACAPTAASLTLVGQLGDVVSGEVLNPQPVVEIRDANGFRIGSSTLPVTASIVGASGTLSGTTTVNAVNGVASFLGLRLSGTGSFRIAFSAPGVPTINSNSFQALSASCAAPTVGLPFSITGNLAGSLCDVNARDARSVAVNNQSQGAIELDATSAGFSPFVKFTEAAGRGNYTIWAADQSVAARFLLEAGPYVASVGNFAGTSGAYTFSGMKVSEDISGCGTMFILQPVALTTSQALGSGDCVLGSAYGDVISTGSAGVCTITMRSSAFSTYLVAYGEDGTRLQADAGGAESRIRLAPCYYGKDSQYVFGVHVYASSYEPSKSGPYTLTIAYEPFGSIVAGASEPHILLIGAKSKPNLTGKIP